MGAWCHACETNAGKGFTYVLSKIVYKHNFEYFVYLYFHVLSLGISKEMKSQADTVAFSILGAFLLQEKVLNAHFIIWFSDFEWRATELSKFNKNDWNIKVDNDFSSQNYVDLSL